MRVVAEDLIVGLQREQCVADFWQWAFSDLCDDDVKGWYAEWVVGKLLGIFMDRRISWANSDLITPGGVRIEVKSTALWQSWKLLDELGQPREVKTLGDNCMEKVRFSGLKTRDSVAHSSQDASYKSDLYVFAFQKQRDHELWDALDLSHWEFYVLSKDQLTGTKSISLAQLRTFCPPMSSADLEAQGRRLVMAIEGRRCDLFGLNDGRVKLSCSIFLKDGILRGVGSATVLEETLGSVHAVGDRSISPTEDPEEWFNTLPIMYSGSYCWAEIVS